MTSGLVCIWVLCWLCAGAAWSRIGASAPVLPASTCSIATLWPHSEILSPSLAGGWCIFSKICTSVFLYYKCTVYWVVCMYYSCTVLPLALGLARDCSWLHPLIGFGSRFRQSLKPSGIHQATILCYFKSLQYHFVPYLSALMDSVSQELMIFGGSMVGSCVHYKNCIL